MNPREIKRRANTIRKAMTGEAYYDRKYKDLRVADLLIVLEDDNCHDDVATMAKIIKGGRTMNKYKLCRIHQHECGEVRPVDENGNEYGNALYTYDDETDYAYAIYENLGDDNDEDWVEYDWYGDDFAKAVEGYKKLKGDD